MEVSNCSRSLLSNLEVHQFLKQIQSGKEANHSIGKNQTHLATIIYESVQYLDSTVCRTQKPEQVSAFLPEIAAHPKIAQLTKAERLMLVNHTPTEAVEIQVIVQDSDTRLSDESDVTDLLSLIKKHFPRIAKFFKFIFESFRQKFF